jgi:hypothetical protein
MARRMTDTEKWKKAFLRGLDAPCKLLWFYICDDCDHAGIWNVDMEVAEIRIGEKLDMEFASKIMADKIIIFDNGKKWFVPSFVEFQYPKGLNPSNKAHASVINILKKYNLLKYLPSPFQGAMEGAKDKELDKELDKDIEATVKDSNSLCGQMVQIFRNENPEYPTLVKTDAPACLQIAQKIALAKGWPSESITNSRAPDILAYWLSTAKFVRGHSLYGNFSIEDLNRKWQGVVQTMNKSKNNEEPGKKNSYSFV